MQFLRLIFHHSDSKQGTEQLLILENAIWLVLVFKQL